MKDGTDEASPDDARFLLEVPEGVSTRGASGTTSAHPEMISVSELKALITKLEEWRKEGEGVEGYLECIRGQFRS